MAAIMECVRAVIPEATACEDHPTTLLIPVYLQAADVSSAFETSRTNVDFGQCTIHLENLEETHSKLMEVTEALKSTI
jgi:hypothetical protein